jgi:hypothetical protein
LNGFRVALARDPVYRKVLGGILARLRSTEQERGL